ncbi:MAG: glycoside hydrolase family 28 protein [Phycisphaerae bacterium]
MSAVFNAGCSAIRADGPRLPASPAQSHIFNVKDFGATGDGTTVDTAALQKAIKTCVDAGGGRVEVPPGTYLTGPLQLGSNLDLHVDAGATIQFSPNRKDYPLVKGSYEGKQTVVCMSPLTADGAHDISITGAGVFDGHGEQWRQTKKSKLSDAQWKDLVASGGVVDQKGTTWYPSREALEGLPGLMKLRDSEMPPKVEDFEKYRDLLRPVLLSFSNCRRVLLDGPTFRNSAAWNLHPYLCEDLTIRNVTLFNPEYAQNGDGVDIDSCRNVLIEDSKVDAGDDAICLKSGKDEEGRRLGKPTEHVTVRRCTIGTGHGAIAIGSEMSGGIRDVNVSHCTMNGTDTGIRVKTTRGRGNVVENITVSDITMRHINGSAIEFNMYYMVKGEPKPQPVSEGTPRIRDIHLTGVQCADAKQAIVIKGLPEMPIEDISIADAQITAKSAGEISYAKNVTLTNVQLHTGNSTLKIDHSEGVHSNVPLVGQ